MNSEELIQTVAISLTRAVAQAEAVKRIYRRQLPINGGYPTGPAMIAFNRRVTLLRWGRTVLEHNTWLQDSLGDDFLTVIGLYDPLDTSGEN